MSEHSTYTPGNAVEKWLDDRLPIIRFSKEHLMDFPTPKNLNYWWTFGGILALCLMTQIVTGIVLAMHYTPNVDLAFASVERIMRDVNGGWLIRYVHANGASMFFIAVYLHMLRGLYYGSYKAPREMIWIVGCLIFFLLIGRYLDRRARGRARHNGVGRRQQGAVGLPAGLCQGEQLFVQAPGQALLARGQVQHLGHAQRCGRHTADTDGKPRHAETVNARLPVQGLLNAPLKPCLRRLICARLLNGQIIGGILAYSQPCHDGDYGGHDDDHEHRRHQAKAVLPRVRAHCRRAPVASA